MTHTVIYQAMSFLPIPHMSAPNPEEKCDLASSRSSVSADPRGLRKTKKMKIL